MSYSSPDHLGAWTAFGAMPAAEAAALTAQVNARVAEIRNAGTQLITELNSSAVARVFVQQGIDAAGNVVDVINNALSATGTVPSLLKKAIAGDTAAPQKILDLLEKFQQTLLDLRADFDSLWAQAGTASRLLSTMLAGLSELGSVVIGGFREAGLLLPGNLSSSTQIGIIVGVAAALGVLWLLRR